MTHKQFMRIIRKQGACPEGVEWCEKHGGTPEEMWRDCDQGDFIGWVIRQNLLAMGYTVEDWMRALGRALIAGGYRSLGRAMVAGDMRKVRELGFPLGLTDDLDFPSGEWLLLKETTDVFKSHFDPFREQTTEQGG